MRESEQVLQIPKSLEAETPASPFRPRWFALMSASSGANGLAVLLNDDERAPEFDRPRFNISS